MSLEKEGSGELYVKDRRILKMSGVNNIESLDEDYVSLSTDGGRVVIEGKGLRVESLDKESGEIEIGGSICGVFFSEKKSKEGFFRRIFK